MHHESFKETRSVTVCSLTFWLYLDNVLFSCSHRLSDKTTHLILMLFLFSGCFSSQLGHVDYWGSTLHRGQRGAQDGCRGCRHDKMDGGRVWGEMHVHRKRPHLGGSSGKPRTHPGRGVLTQKPGLQTPTRL